MIGHLYVHIPFCPKVCPYCSFYKEVRNPRRTDAFLRALLSEAERHSQRLRPETIFFGGGTPTALSTRDLERLVSGLRARIDLSSLREFTVEMNPATVSSEKAASLLALGVNRVSMGVQSWDSELLRTLGRVHTDRQARDSFEILRQAGFENVNLDLIFGIPGQTLEQWERTLAATVSLNPEHISAYCLTYEEDTEYFLRLNRGQYQRDESRDTDFFEMTMDVLQGSGFYHYEISNYARRGRECRHNLAYWLGADFLGLGPSAFSTVDLCRWKNVSDTAAYISALENRASPSDFREVLDESAWRVERIAFSLRTNRGVAAGLLSPSRAEKLAEIGLLRREADRWCLTREGKPLADSIAVELI
jgi:oxygen-independent coproporphyrinogen III oxidase